MLQDKGKEISLMMVNTILLGVAKSVHEDGFE